MKSLFEKLGGTYTLGKDGMYYPNLTVENTAHRPIGKWGRMHKAFLEEVHPGLYEGLILNDTLHKHLADVNERAMDMLDCLIRQMSEREGVTERLKAEQPLTWVGRMNNIKARAEEIIQADIVDTI